MLIPATSGGVLVCK